MQKLLKLPVGIENFKEIRSEGFYYVDKTGLIEQLLGSWCKVNLFTRPRRFGKTLNMSMLKCFLRLAVRKTTLNEFCDAFLAGEAEKIEQMLGDYLWNMISVRDNAVKEKKENFYHGMWGN